MTYSPPQRSTTQAEREMSDDTGSELEKAEEEIAVSRREDALMKIPAVYSDRFWFSWWKNHIRLAFGEYSIRDGEYWRFVVLLETADIKRLITRLQRALVLLEEREEKDKK
jgi:hypothetical protein